MKNLLPQCEKPAIILNPNLKDLVLLYGNYYLNDKLYKVDLYIKSRYFMEFPYSKFSRIKKHLSFDDIEKYYVIDGNGERQPIFMAVCCGKCPICKDKKAREWSTRAMCESQTSMSVPYFFTLTYNNNTLPRNGVRKGAMQRFMKRLRINVERYCGFKTNIRYFICAEYGSKTKRPHYHGIIWNLPPLQERHVDDLIDKSWSFATSKNYYDSISDEKDMYGHPVYKYICYEKKKPQYRIKFGYTHTSQCTEGRVRYAMKYMRKESDIPSYVDTSTGEIKYQNPIFYLASRRGGLGSSWIESKLEEYRKNPSLLDVKLTDVWSGEQYTGTMPQFFKNKICPTNSLLIKKSIRDTYKLWNYTLNKFHSAINYHYSPNPKILEKYPSLPFHKADIPFDKFDNSQCDEFTVYENQMQYSRSLNNYLILLEDELLAYEYDVGLAISSPLYKKEHLKYVEKYIASQPQMNVDDRMAFLERSRIRRVQKEKL